MRALVGRALAALSLAVALYIVYAHAASWRLSKEYTEDPIALRFDGAGWASGFEVRQEGGLVPTVRSGRLEFRGPTADPSGTLARVEIAGPVRRLRDVEIRIRFRARDAASYDLAVGVERAGTSHATTARVLAGLRNDPTQPSYRFFGDERAEVPRAGDALEKQRFVPFDRPNDEHEVALRISPDLHAMLASVDGVPVSSHLAGWDEGVAVRPLVVLRAREPGQAIDVDVLAVDYVPLPRDTRPHRLDELFDGQALDPRRWRVLQGDGWTTHGDVAFEKPGLRLLGGGLRPMRETPMVALVANTVTLGSFHASMRFAIRKLHRARLYLGVSNPLFGLADWRTFEVGLVDGPTHVEAFAAGHWEGDGRFVVTALPGVAADAERGELAIDYDATTGVARATLDGRDVTRQRLDFQPPEEIHLELGVRALAADAEADVRVEDVHVEPRPWTEGEDIAAHWAPDPPADGGGVGEPFFDGFATDSLARYRVLVGAAKWGAASSDVQLGPDSPRGPAYHELVRGYFDAPVTVTGTILVEPDPIRGDIDSAGVMAVDRNDVQRYLATIWYGTQLPQALHLTSQTEHGDVSLAAAPLDLALGKRYRVKMRIERHNVYARAWLDDPKAIEPDGWMVSAPIDEGWTATGGVGFAANATATRVTELRAELP